MLKKQQQEIEKAVTLMKKSPERFASNKPLTSVDVSSALAETGKGISNVNSLQRLDLQGKNPFVESLVIDWTENKITAQLFADVAGSNQGNGSSEDAVAMRDEASQYIINEIALASQQSDENIEAQENGYAVNLGSLSGAKSILAFDLGYIAKKRASDIVEQIQSSWEPTHKDLMRESYPVYAHEEFKDLKPEEQKLALVVYAPAADSEQQSSHLRPGSIYVIAKDLEAIIQKYRASPDAPDAPILAHDLEQLKTILEKSGFIFYPGSSFGANSPFAKDYIFELPHYYDNLIDATRENFYVKGNQRYAVLDFTDVEQRILALNKIDDRVQEDLLKWRESYQSSLVDINKSNRYLVPAPTENAFLANWKLDAVKYFRGDDRKILKWGLDLSGGKTVRIGLRDRNNRPVTDPADLQQALNELYVRVNKMGVSERTIHIENENIVLDFPGSQALSAAELVKASAMSFNIVNEKFSSQNAALRESANEFLQNVWNEAVVTNRKDAESVNEIAWQHLGGDNSVEELSKPRSRAAQVLFDSGLVLANPKTTVYSHAFNDTLSIVGILAEGAHREFGGNPLVFLFHNFALEGSSLTNVRAGYDPMQGNVLSFAVKSSYEGSQSFGNPQDELLAWTSQFAKDQIAGTPKAVYSNGNGWRLAVVLNGTVISNPTLNAALRDGGTISGHFSQREINKLASDLKAGSLSFTPKILSEENVSAELGSEERAKGIWAAIIAAVALVGAMIGYYRFAGVVASVALFFNVLIMWGILQNLGAALSLPTIAGIVLTIGMAVDANVLVFERIREEFAISGKIASAIQTGYRKAFSAIVDSNITTVIAALILIQFDSGPIKGFAVALIVGIVSSMFTSLFMTRYFFAGWVQNPKNKSLEMNQFFGLTHFEFLGQAKKAVIISAIVTLLGGALFYAERHTIFGMDFTGGYALQLELEPRSPAPDYRTEVINALVAAGASPKDVQVRELSRPNQLHIQLGMGLEEPNNPFHGMAEDISTSTAVGFLYQNNPRLNWVVNSLEDKGVQIPKSQLMNVQNKWTIMSGQFSETMRNNAVMALILALLSVLVYITIRFEFKFAVGAVIGLLHDVVITLGIFAFFHWAGFPVQIDITIIGAIMTIIGYSLNDTIIVFDRIREDIRLLRKLSFPAVINHALNVTLSRTVMTSGTTLLVLLSLVLFGGKTIFGFSLMMLIGILVGTFSSLYVASPIMLYIHDREEAKKKLNSSAMHRA